MPKRKGGERLRQNPAAKATGNGLTVRGSPSNALPDISDIYHFLTLYSYPSRYQNGSDKIKIKK